VEDTDSLVMRGLARLLAEDMTGAIADRSSRKKQLLALFAYIGSGATIGLLFLTGTRWLLGAALFILANIAFGASVVVYNSFLPQLAKPDDRDAVSSRGWAIGYIGGGLLLALNVAWILSPSTFGISDAGQASRLSFLSVALWWALFSIPLFRRVPEPAVVGFGASSTAALMRASLLGLLHTLRDLRRYRQAFLLLVAFVIYSDGIGTIIRLATSYGTELGLNQGSLITAILLVQFVGIPFAFLFGMLAGRIGAKTAIFIALAVYTLITVAGYYMKTERDFYILAFMVASVQGGSQALSRSLFASMIPKERSSEFFGFFSIFEKFGAIAGPAAFEVASRTTGSSRSAILSVMVFFIAGAVVLAFVDVRAGQQAVRGK